LAGTKRTEITIETHRITIIRRQGSVRSWCPDCRQETEFVSAEEAASIVPALAPADSPGYTVHRLSAQGGAVLVCLTCLLDGLAQINRMIESKEER